MYNISKTIFEQPDEDIKIWVKESWEFVISNSMMNILMLALSVILHGVISLAGVFSNSVNVLVFIRLGLKDSMSVGLWALSFTDLGVCIFQLASCISYLVAFVYPYAPIDPWTVGSYVCAWPRFVCYFISCWITTIIAVERWYCVVYPFNVKQVFTKKRCVVVIISAYVFHFSIVIPVLASYSYVWGAYPTGQQDQNGTDIYFMQMQLLISEESAKWESTIETVAELLLPLPSQAIILICTIWMVISLKASSRVRKRVEFQQNDGAHHSKSNLTARETRLVKIVILLAVISTVCNIPRYAVEALHHLLPGAMQGAYNNLDTFLWELSYIFGTVCCASNIFVYLIMNDNFRSQFQVVCDFKLSLFKK